MIQVTWGLRVSVYTFKTQALDEVGYITHKPLCQSLPEKMASTGHLELEFIIGLNGLMMTATRNKRGLFERSR